MACIGKDREGKANFRPRHQRWSSFDKDIDSSSLSEISRDSDSE